MLTGNITIEQAQEIELVQPQNAGSAWQGIRHGDLIDSVLDHCLFNGWKHATTKIAMDKTGRTMAASFGVEIPGLPAPQDQRFNFGIINNNSREKKLRVVVGTDVFVCSNGAVFGSHVVARKHTKGLNLDELMGEAFRLYRGEAEKVALGITALQRCPLTEDTANRIICEAGRQGIMCWSRLGEVDAEYHNPRFSDHGVGTSWALFNAFTWVVKRDPPLEQLGKTDRFRKLLPTLTVA